MNFQKIFWGFKKRMMSGNERIGIPKIIMQTWKNHVVPDEWKESPESIKKCMPDWEYVLMTDEMNRNFVLTHFPDFLPYYDGFEYPIQRADAIRYMWLYIKGGVYMDLDNIVKKNLSPLFKSDCDAYFVRSGNVSIVYTNAFMASKPGCKIWLQCIEAMKQPLSWYNIGRHLKVMNSTGPLMLSSVLSSTKEVFANLPPELFMPCSICETTCSPNSDVYVQNSFGQSWCGVDSHLYNFTLCYWRKVLLIVFIILVLLLIFWILRALFGSYNDPLVEVMQL